MREKGNRRNEIQKGREEKKKGKKGEKIKEIKGRKEEKSKEGGMIVAAFSVQAAAPQTANESATPTNDFLFFVMTTTPAFQTSSHPFQSG